mgnify:CR=1 FL=1
MAGILVCVGFVLIVLALVVLWRSAESGSIPEKRIAAAGTLVVIGFIAIIAGWAMIDATAQKVREGTTLEEKAPSRTSVENH